MNAEALEAHRHNVETIISTRALVDAVRLDEEIAGPVVAFGIARGTGAERTSRNRGADTFVVPVARLRNGLSAWLGYREEWAAKPAGKSKTFRFISSGITIHFGFEGIDPKPQMFRAEWAGLVERDVGYAFQAGDAGHPHWQFDAMESAGAATTSDDAKLYAEMIRSDAQEPELRDFDRPMIAVPEVHTVVGSTKMAAIHFASAAPWWRPAPEDTHSHYPKDVQQLRRWLGRTLSYLVAELDRV